MGFFAYKAIDPSGEPIKGVVEASSVEEAAKKIRRNRLYPVKIEPAGKIKNQRKISDELVISFCKDIADLLGAGLPIDRALTLLVGQEINPSFKRILSDVAKSVQEGKALSDAIESHEEVFGTLVVHMIRAGEASGALEPVLKRLAGYLERQRTFKQNLVSSSIYPLLLLGMSLLSMTVLLIYVVPKFARIFEDIHQTIPPFTRILISAGSALENYGWTIPLILAGLYLLIRKISSTPKGKKSIDRALTRIPLIRKLTIYSNLSRFFLAMGTMVRAGVPILRAIALARNVVGNTVIKTELAPLYESVKSGKPVSSVFAGKELFPPRVAHMLRVGEERGELGDTLLALASYFEGETEKILRRLMTLMEPAIIIGTGVVIGAIVLSMFSTIISISDIRF